MHGGEFFMGVTNGAKTGFGVDGKIDLLQGLLCCTDSTAVRCDDGKVCQGKRISDGEDETCTASSLLDYTGCTVIQSEDEFNIQGQTTLTVDDMACTTTVQNVQQTKQALTGLESYNIIKTGVSVRNKIELFENKPLEKITEMRIKKRGRRRKNVGDLLGGGLVQSGIQNFTISLGEPSLENSGLGGGPSIGPNKTTLVGQNTAKLEFLGIIDSMRKRRLSGVILTPDKKHRKC
jgi:hypothetical protein